MHTFIQKKYLEINHEVQMNRKLVLVLFLVFACTLWAADSDADKAAVIKIINVLKCNI